MQLNATHLGVFVRASGAALKEHIGNCINIYLFKLSEQLLKAKIKANHTETQEWDPLPLHLLLHRNGKDSERTEGSVRGYSQNATELGPLQVGCVRVIPDPEWVKHGLQS